MEDLIERLGTATAPDREVDLAIRLLVEPDGDIARLMQFPRGLDKREGMAWDIWHGSVVFEKYALGACHYNGGYPLPAYTASIDAALTLVPDGLYWMAGFGKESEDEPLGGTAIFRPGDNIIPVAEAEAATVALSVCIAALKARRATSA